MCMCARTRLCSLPWTRLAAALALVGVPCRRRWTAPPSRHNPRMGMRMNCKNGAQGLYAMRMRGRTRPDLLLYTGGAPHSAACNPLSASMSKRRMSALFSASREVVDLGTCYFLDYRAYGGYSCTVFTAAVKALA